MRMVILNRKAASFTWSNILAATLAIVLLVFLVMIISGGFNRAEITAAFCPGACMDSCGGERFILLSRTCYDGRGDLQRGQVCCVSPDDMRRAGLEDEVDRETPIVIGDYEQIVVYATQESFSGDLGGRSGANEKCAEGVPSGLSCENVNAFLTVSESDTIDALPYTSTGVPVFAYRSAGATRVADSWESFLKGEFTEQVVMQSLLRVWTGANTTGGFGSSDLACSSWTDGSDSVSGSTAETLSGSAWLASGQMACSTQNKLLCACTVDDVALEPVVELRLSDAPDEKIYGGSTVRLRTGNSYEFQVWGEGPGAHSCTVRISDVTIPDDTRSVDSDGMSINVVEQPCNGFDEKVSFTLNPAAEDVGIFRVVLELFNEDRNRISSATVHFSVL